QDVGWMLSKFGKEVRSEVLAYAEATQVYDLDVAEAIAKALGQDGVEAIAEGLDMKIESAGTAEHFRRVFGLLAPLDWSKYLDKAWKIACSEHAAIRDVACAAIAKLDAPKVIGAAKLLLEAKKSDERAAGITVLARLGTPEAKKILGELRDREASDDARDLIVREQYREPAKIDLKEVARRVAVAKERGKLAKPVAKWLDEK